MDAFDRLNEILKEKYEEIEPLLYRSEEGLIRTSRCRWEGEDKMLVEFAENGVEADNMLFDDVDFYPLTEEGIKWAIEDLEP